jgi:hypothetical protein
MQPTEFRIKDVTFYVDKFRARQGFIVLGELQKDLFPIIGGFFTQGTTDVVGDAAKPDSGQDMAAFIEASSKINGAMLEKWMDKLINGDMVSFEKPGQRAQKISRQNFDDAFEDFTDIVQLLFEIIKLNFAGPLVRWLGHIGPGLNLKAGELLGNLEKN